MPQEIAPKTSKPRDERRHHKSSRCKRRRQRQQPSAIEVANNSPVNRAAAVASSLLRPSRCSHVLRSPLPAPKVIGASAARGAPPPVFDNTEPPKANQSEHTKRSQQGMVMAHQGAHNGNKDNTMLVKLAVMGGALLSSACSGNMTKNTVQT